MEEIIQDLDRYFQHARRTRLNTFTSASVLAANARKAIAALKKLLNDPEYSSNARFLEELIRGLSKAEGIYEKYCETLNSEHRGNDQLFINLNHTLYNNLDSFLQVFYHNDSDLLRL
ncbi:hypothetical protein [Fluviicola sp.]|uniref:hypothetical protein n=1 Tax=Fluviicola sp. TaxID=1917219 RepID=UPI0031CDEC72